MQNRALILVDFENEWIDETSPYFVGKLDDLIDRTNKLIDFCRKENYKIIFVTHIEKDSKTIFIEDSKNTEIINNLDFRNKDVLIKKYKISPFYKTDLEKELKEINEIVVCGILTNLCVRSTINDAYDRDFKITLISDCTTAFDKETHDFTLNDIKSTREEVKIISLKEFTKN